MVSKPKAKRPARHHPDRDIKPTTKGAKMRKGSASSRSTANGRKTPSRSSSGTASPAPQTANGLKHEDRDTSTPSSETSQAVRDFYTHMEAASSESSRWDTDSVLGAVLEDMTEDTGTPAGETIPTRLSPFFPCSSLAAWFPYLLFNSTTPPCRYISIREAVSVICALFVRPLRGALHSGLADPCTISPLRLYLAALVTLSYLRSTMRMRRAHRQRENMKATLRRY